jgi:hypothetical protein
MISISKLAYLRHTAERTFAFQFGKSLFYFRRRCPDRHGRTRDFAGTRRRVDADNRPMSTGATGLDWTTGGD